MQKGDEVKVVNTAASSADGVTPSRLEGAVALLDAPHPWGWEVLCGAAASGRFRAAWDQMETIEGKGLFGGLTNPEPEGLSTSLREHDLHAAVAGKHAPRAVPRDAQGTPTGQACTTCGAETVRKGSTCTTCPNCGEQDRCF
jgi:hypothetical protein